MHRGERREPRGAGLEFGLLGVDPRQHQAHLRAALAAQPAQLERLFGDLAARVAEAPRKAGLDLARGSQNHRLEQFAALRQQLVGERRLQRRQPALRQAGRIGVDARGQRLAGRERKDALDRHVERARGRGLLGVDLGPHRALVEQRVGQRIDLVQHHESRQRLRAQVLGPDRPV